MDKAMNIEIASIIAYFGNSGDIWHLSINLSYISVIILDLY